MVYAIADEAKGVIVTNKQRDELNNSLFPRNTINLIKVYSRPENKESLGFKVEINGKPYEFAIRFLGEEKTLTILKPAELWYVETETFGHPFED